MSAPGQPQNVKPPAYNTYVCFSGTVISALTATNKKLSDSTCDEVRSRR